MAQSVWQQVTDWMAGVRFRAETRDCLLHGVKTGSGAHPVSCAMGTGGSFSGVKWPGRDADRSPLSSAEVRNGGGIHVRPHTSSSRGA
jgi:hypothetical protein